MKICAVGQQTDAQRKLLQLFQKRGNEIISGAEDLLPPADIYFCTTITKPLETVNRGLVILDLRFKMQPDVAAKAIYADICLVRGESDRQTLIEEYRCEPARVFVATDNRRVFEIMEQGVRGTLPPTAVPPSPVETTRFSTETLSPEQAMVQIRARLQSIERQADVMLHNYQVQSGVPIVGKFIAWFRRNLTAHLREPYLDPMFKKQVAFNTQIAHELQTLLSMQADLLHRVDKLEQVIFSENDEND